MKRICSIAILFICISSLFFSCSSQDQNTTLNGTNTVNEYPIAREGYVVNGFDTLERWVTNSSKAVLPNDLMPITAEDQEKYGDLSYLIDLISAHGYFCFTQEDQLLSLHECSLYDAENIHDMFLWFEVQQNGEALWLPCYITYIPDEASALAQSSPVECILHVRGIELYDADAPLTVNNEKLIRVVREINIGGEMYQAITQEYVDSPYSGKLGAIFLIVGRMIVQIQKPYSDGEIALALEHLQAEIRYVNADENGD